MYLTMFVFISTVGPSLYKNEWDEKAFIFDESIVMILIYHMVCVTSFVKDAVVKNQVGFSMIILSLVFIVVKLLPLFIWQARKICRSSKENLHKYKLFRKKKELDRDMKKMKYALSK